MSLITCIECGKKISSHATACPKCGCPTSLSIKQEADKADKKQKRVDKVKEKVEMPTRPIEPGAAKNYSLYYIIGGILSGIGMCITFFSEMINETELLISMTTLIVGAALFIYGWYDNDNYKKSVAKYNYDLQKYNLAMKDFEAYKDEIANVTIIMEDVRKSKRNTNSVKPHCPKCNSTAITAGQRGYKLMTGFLGSNKTVNRCANCGHSWSPGR